MKLKSLKLRFPLKTAHVLTSCLALYFALTPWLYSPQRIYRNASKSTVVIRSYFALEKDDGTILHGFSTCSGVFVDNIHVLTNNHCIDTKNPLISYEKSEVETVDGSKFSVRLQKSNRIYDLALFEINHPKRGVYRAVKLGTNPKIGDTVYTVGHPYELYWYFSQGIVAKKLEDKGLPYILHTAPINMGNSGGPLLDKHGRLVGLNEFTITFMGMPWWSGVSGAIDICTIRHFLGVY